MKTKGARLTTEISLPALRRLRSARRRLGVSRRLEDDERNRLKAVIKEIAPKQGGLIVRTAAEGASAEDVARDLEFLQRLWKTIEARAKDAAAPTLIYQEAELPLRVTRDLFTESFERLIVDHDLTYKRIVGYLKKTSPHMVDRVVRYKEKEPLLEAFGAEAEIKSTLSRRVDLPSGGYLIFDYAEAFTVIDVNTGRFVGSRGKNAGPGRLEDTITKNNLEAVKEVVRQLRLRDIGGIIVIDFIDMANPKNRAAVEEALRTELERDRTKTYVVEISPLGLVEMTRQNVTDGPREIMTRKCPTCGGDGIVYSEASAAIDVERRIRSLAAGSSRRHLDRAGAPIASALVGSGARRLIELEALTKRRFFFGQARHAPTTRLASEGKLADLAPKASFEEGAELTVELVEVDRHDAGAAVGKLDGLDIIVGEAAELVGKKVKVHVERVLDGIAYATLVRQAKKAPEPLTAEAEAEKPTRKPPARKTGGDGTAEDGDGLDAGDDEDVAESPTTAAEATGGRAVATARGDDDEADGETETRGDRRRPSRSRGGAPAKKKTRRGSRGGRNRKKPAGAAGATPAQRRDAGRGGRDRRVRASGSETESADRAARRHRARPAQAASRFTFPPTSSAAIRRGQPRRPARRRRHGRRPGERREPREEEGPARLAHRRNRKRPQARALRPTHERSRARRDRARPRAGGAVAPSSPTNGDRHGFAFEEPRSGAQFEEQGRDRAGSPRRPSRSRPPWPRSRTTLTPRTATGATSPCRSGAMTSIRPGKAAFRYTSARFARASVPAFSTPMSYAQSSHSEEAVPRPRGRAAAGRQALDRWGLDLRAARAARRRRRHHRPVADHDRHGARPRPRARREDPDRQVQEAHRLPEAQRLSQPPDADPDRVDRRHGEEGSGEEGRDDEGRGCSDG